MSQLSDASDSNKKNHDIPLDHLDFKYVEQCNDVKELEKIYKVLLSGVEGRFVELEHTVETKIRRLAPNSRVLRKDVPIVDKRGISKTEQTKLDAEIEEFVKSIPNLAKEISKNKLQSDDTTDDTPPVRNIKEPIVLKTEAKAAKTSEQAAKPAVAAAAASKKSAKPKDYSEWEKIEKQLEKEPEVEVEVEEKKKKQESEKKSPLETSVNSAKNKLIKTLPTNVKEEDESVKAIRAEQEKCKGNEAFNAKSYDEAVVYYTRSIQLQENAAAFNNRALAFLKLEKWDKVIEDCNSVFKYEADNVKALLRRATAFYNKKRLNDAKKDIEIVISKEVNNKKAQELHEEIKKALTKESEEQEEIKAKGGKRLTIEETDGDSEEEEVAAPVEATSGKKSIKIQEVEQDDEDDEDDEKEEQKVETVVERVEEVKRVEIVSEGKVETITETTQVEVKVVEEKPLPQKVVELKDRANKDYANGQYGEAITYFTKAIDQLKHDFSEDDLKLYFSNTLATLYSNRASSRQRNGEFKEAINDCNRSLELRDGNIKVLFKKAHLLELSEKYQESLGEYQKIMRLDSTYKQAQEGYNRVKNLLISRGELKTERPATKPDVVKTVPVVPVAKLEPVLTFDQLKEKGNEFFKQTNYTEALKFYTKCIEMENTNPIAYLNRSICSIKLNDGQGALNDCNFVLKNEPKNVKALYRRALANRLLMNLNDSVRDLKEVIAIEPKNAIAIKDLAEIEKQLQTTAKQTTKKQAEPTKATKQKQPEAATVPLKKKPVKFENDITNNYEFLQAWNSISPDDIPTYCHLLEKIDSQKLAKYIGSKLDDNMLSTFIKTFHRYIFDEDFEHYEDDDGYNLIDQKQKMSKNEIYNYLLQLTKTQRFDIIKMFLSEDLKLLLNKCFNYFNEQLNTNGPFSSQDIQKLKKLYGL